MHGHVCVSVCVSVTLSVNSPTAQTPQRIFTVDSFTQGCAFLGSRRWIITFRGPKSPKTTHFGGLNRHFSQICKKNSNSFIFRSVYQIDMKFDRQLRPATETSWVVSYGGKTIPRWRTAAILKIDISPYLSEQSSDLHEILYTAADFKLDERDVIKNEKVALDRLRVRQNVFLVFSIFLFTKTVSSIIGLHSSARLPYTGTVRSRT